MKFKIGIQKTIAIPRLKKAKKYNQTGRKKIEQLKAQNP